MGISQGIFFFGVKSKTKFSTYMDQEWVGNYLENDRLVHRSIELNFLYLDDIRNIRLSIQSNPIPLVGWHQIKSLTLLSGMDQSPL